MQCGMVRMLMKELKELLDVLPKWALNIFLSEGLVNPLRLQLIKCNLSCFFEMKDIQGKNVLTYRKLFSLFLLCHKKCSQSEYSNAVMYLIALLPTFPSCAACRYHWFCCPLYFLWQILNSYAILWRGFVSLVSFPRLTGNMASRIPLSELDLWHIAIICISTMSRLVHVFENLLFIVNAWYILAWLCKRYISSVNMHAAALFKERH